MAIDTKPTMLERVVEARKDRARFRRKNGMDSAMELIVDEPAAATRPNLDALLAHLELWWDHRCAVGFADNLGLFEGP